MRLPLRQQVQNRHEFRDDFGEIASVTGGTVTIEQAANATNSLTCIERFIADVLKHLGGRLDHRFRAVEHALAGLRKGRDGADRLIQFVRNATRHFFQRGDPRNLE